MFQQKISPARIYLLLAIIITISGVLGIILVLGKMGKNNPPIAAIPTVSPLNTTNPIEKEITITTDKTEYEQGKTIKIVVNNGLNKSILYSRVAGLFWDIEYFKDDSWISFTYKEGGGFQLTEKNIGEACHIALYERLFPEELTSQLNLTAQWNQKICPVGTESPDKPRIVRHAESGKYRLVFYYGFEISSNDYFKILEPKTIYSNEFTISEKTSGDKLKFSSIIKGTSSSQKEAKNFVIKNESEWIPILQKTDAELPASIDFNKYMTIALFQGEKNTGGYDVEIRQILEKENIIEVFAIRRSPGTECTVTQAFTSSYHIVKIAKQDKEIRFKIVDEINHCAIGL